MATGYYGGFAKVLFADNVWERVTAIYNQARAGEVNWYLTYTDDLFMDAWQIHTYGTGGGGDSERTRPSFLWIDGKTGTNATCAVTYRNNDFRGYTLSVDGTSEGVRGAALDKNAFSNVTYGMFEKADSRSKQMNTWGCAGCQSYTDNTTGIGGIQLDASQLARADFYSEGEITLRDSAAIRHYQLTGKLIQPDVPQPEPPPEPPATEQPDSESWFDGNF